MYSCWGWRGPQRGGFVGGGSMAGVELMSGCLCAWFYSVSQLVLWHGSNVKEGFSEVSCSECTSGKIAEVFDCVHLCKQIKCVGGWGKREVLGQLRLCPASADHISPIHPCHVDCIACMCDCLTFLRNESSTCGTSDVADVCCPCCSLPILVWEATQVAHTQTRIPWGKKQQHTSPLAFLLGKYIDRVNCLSRHFKHHWDNGDFSSHSTIGPHKKHIQTFQALIPRM